MTTRNLDALFEPHAIALIGASNRDGSVGSVLARNLLESGFAGPVLPVNPHEGAIRSAMAYAKVADLPVTPDLAVIATPPQSIPGLIAELGARGCRAAVVISTGFGADAGPDGARLKAEMLQAAKPHLLRIIGPNCLGFISPARGINASFAHLTPAAGRIALVAQSGAVAAAAIDWAHAQGIGFSHIVTIGDAADVDFGDLLDYLALDAATQAILLYVESIHDARKFMTAARIASRNKPVVVVKTGRSAAGAKAAFSHTGALAGSDAVYDAAFRRAGLLRVGELRELFEAVQTLGAGLTARGDRLAILTNGGGAGVMATDALEARGGRLAQLSPGTIAALNAAAPANWSHGNPADILGDAKPALYAKAMEALLAEPEADAILVMNCPTAVASSTEAAQAVVDAVLKARSGKPVLTAWLGQTAVEPGRKLLAAAGLPVQETPDEAVRAFMHLVEHRRGQALLMRVPTVGDLEPPAPELARQVLDKARAEGRRDLTDPEARQVLAAYGVPVVESRIAATPLEAGQAAEALGGPVALKILSRDISHKSDSGGVMLNLEGAAAVELAAGQMLERVRKAVPDARIEGFVLQPMIRRPKAQELLAGIAQDPTFGPVILFGQGGIGVEILADRTVGLPPLDDVLARDMIARTRVAKLLAGYRDRPPADLEAVTEVLIRLARLAVELPQIAELDINPLLADDSGVIALDARIRLSAPEAVSVRTAIGAYPRGLDRTVTLEGEVLTLRPIRPLDAPRLIEMIDRSSAEDVRLRFRTGVQHLPDSWAARLSQIDYDRELALVAETAKGEVVGVGRLAGDPEGATAEFALMVRTDHHGHGLGHALMTQLIEQARAKGLKSLWGDVARDNPRMLQLADALGFSRHTAEDPARVKVELAL
ncbi:bifunctional acetate--CoA ligase family protein/GNAT family N-acetyltransferase [Phenylobacterium aquaticum]|uniref:bifunctional acetate--CoA ligase family protein/GNAT family N-acetyltransferase n=1 Tax=Phenylobacterium aquaticum TaxID=1763816 RepID=UPI0026EA4CC1|nr:bifunctional acetate--CoA ligase family protein/GNAT family N-acetyltransferase [Phenylobacterium aquaticum]